MFERVTASSEILLISGIIITGFGLIALGLLGLVLVHTLGVLGKKTIAYSKYPQTKGWDKRFYPAASGLIVLLLALMWLLSAWRHSQSS